MSRKSRAKPDSPFKRFNSSPAGNVVTLIPAVYGALSTLGAPVATAPELTPVVPIRSSVKPDYIVCLEDGAKLKTLKRYLGRKYGMTPDQYRAKWGLPASYPMVAPSYTEHRRALARTIGLGRKAEQEPASEPRSKLKLNLEA